MIGYIINTNDTHEDIIEQIEQVSLDASLSNPAASQWLLIRRNLNENENKYFFIKQIDKLEHTLNSEKLI